MQMKLMVPVDGSQFAVQAVAPAISLARQRGAELDLVHVNFTHPLLPVTPTEAAALQAELHTVAESASRSLGREVAVSTIADLPKPMLQYDTPSAAIAAALGAYAAETGAVAMVMATRSRGAVGRVLLGSVADHLVRESPVPLLLIRPRGGTAAVAPDADESPQFRRILIPLDGSRTAAAAIGATLSTFGTDGITYTLLEGLAPGTEPLGSGLVGMQVWRELAEDRAGAAQDYLNRVAEYLRMHGATVNARVGYAPSSVAVAIARLLESQETDVIALGSHGRRGLSRLLHGSVTTRLLQSSAVPLFVVGPCALATGMQHDASAEELMAL